MGQGLNAARKLLKDFFKFKKKATARYSRKALGAPLFKALALSKTSYNAKQPSSGSRKAVKIQIMKSGQKSVAYIPGDQGRTFIHENDILDVTGIGGSKGKTKGDIPVAVFKVIKVNGISLKQLVLGKKVRKNI